jgi:uncharacterized protein (DUF4415 family)
MKRQETNSTDKVMEVEYSEKDVQELRELGVLENELPMGGVKKYRRSRFAATPSESKIKITMWVDGDVLEHFRQRSADSNAAPYQTQINAELRRIMEKDLAISKIDVQKVEEIAKNKEFVRAVAEQLKELVAA